MTSSLRWSWAGATWYFLSVRGLLREALGYLLHAIETARTTPSLDQSEILYGAAFVAVRLGDYTAAERWSEERLELGRARGDPAVVARSLASLALAVEAQGDLGRARTLYRDAAEAASGFGDTLTLALVANNLGNISLREGDTKAARTQFRQSVELCRELSNTRDEAIALEGLALVALVEEDTDEAAALLGSALRLVDSLGDKELIFACLLGWTEVTAQRGERVRAARLLGASDEVREQIGLADDPLQQEQRVRIAIALGDDGALVAAQSEGRALTLDDAIAYALAE